MTITKCDICKRVIKERSTATTITLPGFSHHELCKDCTKKYLKTVLQVLKKKSELKNR